MTKRVLTGSRPSGSPHLGNYFGALKPAIDLGQQHELFFFLADFHALNEGVPREKMIADSLDLTATMIACGLDPEKSRFYAQSAVPQVSELAWILSCLAPMGIMNRSVAYKDALQKGLEINMGVYCYPILMAADILLFDPHLVPVGQDQKQHLEMCRDFGQRFNNKYKDIFRLPEPLISEHVAIIPGSDGQKMSKSKNNIVSIFASDKEWKKQIMGITTSSEGLDEPKEPNNCTVYKLYKLLAEKHEAETMADKYRKGGYGFGHAKKDLIKKLTEEFGAKREIYHSYMKRPDDLRDIIKSGSKRVRSIANNKLDIIGDCLGLIGRPLL